MKKWPNFGFWSILQGEEPPDPTKGSEVDMSYFGISFPQ